MKNIVGTVQSTEGKFFAKDTSGKITELRNADAITQDMLVYGDPSNTNSSKISILKTHDNSIVEITASEEQLFDGSEEDFDDVSMDTDLSDTTYVDNLLDELASSEEEVPEETEADEEEVKAEGESGSFDARDGNIVDVNSDLREAQFKLTSHLFEIEDQFESETQERLTSEPSPFYSIPVGGPVAITSPTPPPTPTVPVIPTPTTIIPPIPSVPTPPPAMTMIKIFAADSLGNPIKNTFGNYIEVNEAPEGDKAYYVALAFKPNTKVFNDTSKLDTQEGTVDFTFTDGTATRDTDPSAVEGSNDFKPQDDITTITLGTAVHIDALDDYVADSGEKLTVSITNFTPATGTTYGATTVSNDKVTTTITDNTGKPDDNSNGTPPEDNSENVIVRLIALDKDGDPIITAGKYTFANDVVEGTAAQYKALAFESSNTIFAEDSELSVQLGSVTVSSKDNKDTPVSGTDAKAGDDYTALTTTTVALDTAFSVTALDDYLADNGETFTVNIGSYVEPTSGDKYENVTVNGEVTTTIKDNTSTDQTVEGAGETDPVQIVLVAVASSTTTIADITNPDGTLKIINTNITSEGGNLYYIPVAVINGKPLETQGGTVTLTYGVDTDGATHDATTGTDYVNSKASTTIGEVFSVKTNTDSTGEVNENFIVTISNPTGTPYETPVIDDTNKMVTSTIEDSVYVKIIHNDSQVEGNDLTHTVQLVDKNGNPIEVNIPATGTGKLTVTLQYSDDETVDADYSSSHTPDSTFTIDFTGTTNTHVITNKTLDDFISDNNEDYTLTITGFTQDVSNPYTVIGIDDEKSVTGTILDGVTLGTPINASVDEDDFVVTDANTKLEVTKSLGIQKPNEDDDYTLAFDTDVNNIKVFQGDAASSTALTDLKSGGVVIEYIVNANTITGYKGTGRNESDKVFDIVLNKNSDISSGTTTKDDYTYTQYKNIDHPVSGDAGTPANDDDITFEFGFNITDQGQTSDTQKFKVTVNDSMPVSGTKEVAVLEDSLSSTAANKFIISQENFKDGKIEISNDGGSTYTELANTGTIDIKDPNDSAKTIGTLTNNGDGTVTFVPIEDYSNYNAKPSFSYKVSDNDGDYAEGIVNITVKPIADAPSITLSTPEMIEDAGNTKEGTEQVSLGLTKPTLSKDTTDENASGKTGDQPEKNGEITLTFTNGDKVIGAKIFESDGTTQVGSDITAANQTLKVIIINDAKTAVDYDYHHADVTIADINTPPSGTVYLTQAEYQGLKIQHAEDNDTDMKIKIGVTSYELDDSDMPLYGHASYVDDSNTDLISETTKTMTVKINPATDEFTLNWDGTNNAQVQSVDTGTKTVVFNNITENNSNPQAGAVVNNSLDLQALLTATSGTSSTNNTGNDRKLDLDGSEKRSYTIKLTADVDTDLPDFIYITIGDKTDVKAYKNASDEYTVAFDDAANNTEDPVFSMKFPDYWSGTLTGTITLDSIDKGADSTDTAGSVESDSVNFEVTVTPVANIATIQVAQAVGYEDSGRSKGNTEDKDDTIDDVANGIPLEIKVSSDDEDGSEKFDVTISDIPTDAAIYYGGVLQAQTGNSITIVDFDNATSLVVIPPHNDDADFTLNVSATTKDGASVSAPTVTTIDVIVKNVADAPVGTELATDIKVDEDNQLNLQDIYTSPANLASYDATEVLTVKIDFKATGITLDTGSPYFMEDGMYVVKASDITDGKIKLVVPENFSGNADFDLTYVTTEKEEEGNSATWDPQTVSIFVNPIADDVTVAESSTLSEDVAAKVNLTASLKDTGATDGEETIDNVYILKSTIDTMISKDYILTVDGANITTKGTENLTGVENGANGVYYVLTHAEADKLSVINTVTHKVNGNFTLDVAYKVTDTEDTVSDTKIYGHTHEVKVNAVTDTPTLTLGAITQVSGSVTISGTDITIVNENSEFKVPVTTTSSDTDGSEAVTKIVISGVPMGVEVVGGTYYGYSGSEHNGIWVVTPSGDAATKLDADGALSDITFKVNTGANFDARTMTIKTHTQDGANAEIESAVQTIHINDFNGTGTGPGTPAVFTLATKEHDIQEDTQFTLADVLEVNGTNGSGGSVITITDIPEGSSVSGYDYSYEESGKIYYVVVGDGNAADMNTQLSNVLITTPKDMNSDQDGALKGDFKFTADIATHHNGVFNNGNQVTSTQDIDPVTDAMTVAVTAADINEDGTSALSITLSNPSDDTKTELVGNSLTITVAETWADAATGGGANGTLTDSSGKYNVVDNNDGTYTITPILPADNFTVGTAITGLQYTSALNRDGSVKFDVSVENKETGSSATLDSTGSATIKVTPVVDVSLDVNVVTATGTEDTELTINGTTLANPVKLEITAGTFADGSESLGNVILDEVPNGFTVWYKVGTELVMATNSGKTTGADFDVNPNIADTLVHRNKWLIPVNGDLPDIYVNAPTNWSGTFDFDAHFVIKEENLSSTSSQEVQVTGTIDSIADTMTIAPTSTFGDAFSWVDLKLNANMADVDGSETMSLAITGLDDSAQFRLADGNAVNATLDGTTWNLEGITYDQINNIQFASDKSVASVGVTANTVENGNTTQGTSTSAIFELKLSDVSGTLTLDEGINLDFSKLDTLSTLSNVSTIDLSATGENKIIGLTLDDVLNMTDSSNELIITGLAVDKVSFDTENGNTWSKGSTETNGGKTFDLYTNSGNSDLQVKVETTITDSII